MRLHLLKNAAFGYNMIISWDYCCIDMNSLLVCPSLHVVPFNIFIVLPVVCCWGVDANLTCSLFPGGRSSIRRVKWFLRQLWRLNLHRHRPWRVHGSQNLPVSRCCAQAHHPAQWLCGPRLSLSAFLCRTSQETRNFCFKYWWNVSPWYLRHKVLLGVCEQSAGHVPAVRLCEGVSAKLWPKCLRRWAGGFLSQRSLAS